MENALGYIDSFTYDELGRIKTVTDKRGHETEYIYDANGNITETIDAMGHSSYFEYDAMNRLVKMTLWRDDTLHNVHEAQITLYQYDKRGLVKKEINAANNQTIYIYDGNGNLIQKTDAEGYVTEYQYDARNLVDSINYSNQKYVNFMYDAEGRLVKMTDWNGITTFALDILGRISSVKDHNNKTTSYAYDSVGNKTAIVYPGNSAVTYTYDILGRLTQVTEPNDTNSGKVNTTYTYDAAHRMIQMNYANGWVEKNTYDAVGQLTNRDEWDPAKPTSKIQKFQYAYDANGNITGETKSGNNNGTVLPVLPRNRENRFPD